jgi:hypothetical protein
MRRIKSCPAIFQSVPHLPKSHASSAKLHPVASNRDSADLADPAEAKTEADTGAEIEVLAQREVRSQLLKQLVDPAVGEMRDYEVVRYVLALLEYEHVENLGFAALIRLVQRTIVSIFVHEAFVLIARHTHIS